jgi:hypothetical protein
MYGQRYQRQLKKQQQQQQQQQQTNVCLPLAANEEQTIRRIILGKKNENSRGSTPASHRSSPSKSPPPVVTEESLISLTDSKQRSASINRVCRFIVSMFINRIFMLFRKLPTVQEPLSIHRLSLKVNKKKKFLFKSFTAYRILFSRDLISILPLKMFMVRHKVT